MTKKKAGFIVVAAAFIGLAMAGATMAWFTSSAKIENKLSLGYVDISVEEPEYAESEYQQLMPGDSILKDPVIALEDGSQAAYIRVKKPVIVSDDGKEYALFQTDNPFQVILQDGWVQRGEYLYYTKPLGEGSNPKSVELLKIQGSGENRYTMMIPNSWGNDFSSRKITLNFEAEAIQIIKSIKFDFTSENPWTVTGADEIVPYKSDMSG